MLSYVSLLSRCHSFTHTYIYIHIYFWKPFDGILIEQVYGNGGVVKNRVSCDCVSQYYEIRRMRCKAEL